jgi:ribonuclease T1
MAMWILAGCAPPPPDKAEPDSIIAQEASSGHSKHRQHHSDDGAEKSNSSHQKQAHQSTTPHTEPKTSKQPVSGAPDHVLKTLTYIEKHHRAPDGYEGGRVFHNFGGGGEQALPRTDDNGKPVSYHEWDVHAKRTGVNRGAERLVTGSDGSAYYTSDHYRTFTKVR